MSIKLTAYSHGAGCGCKLSPEILQEIISEKDRKKFDALLVGNDQKDDAAVFDLDGEQAIISTTDFFMPIVDDPADFGGIAATNAISDVYAMGGRPIMAIAILGWPIDKLPPTIAKEVLDGARKKCHEAGIPLAGGHSIDSPEPIFGLAVTGVGPTTSIKRNNAGKPGDLLYLTKPLGVGLVTTAQKKGVARPEDLETVKNSMLTLNKIGVDLAQWSYVHALTDVTGFGLGGHLVEMAEASGCSAEVRMKDISRFPFVDHYLALGTRPGGTERNWKSYGHKINLNAGLDYGLIADPQTSGGLLISVDPTHQQEFELKLESHGVSSKPLGELVDQGTNWVDVI